jgi:hypothetical protein
MVPKLRYRTRSDTTEVSVTMFLSALKKIITNNYKDGPITVVHNTYIVAKELKGF